MKRRLKHLALISLAALMILCAIVAARSQLSSSKQVDIPRLPVLKIRDGAAERLARAVRFKTISDIDPTKMDMTVFTDFQQDLVAQFPAAHAVMRRQVVEPCSVVYRWGPVSKSPTVLMAHMDVVPVEDDKLSEWTQSPFSGAIVDGYIWGRGTLDDKIGVVGLLEAADHLAAGGFTPENEVVFAFGCDEEVGGNLGAGRISKSFAAAGMTPKWVLDEGHIIGDGFFPGVTKPIAFIGLAERGFVTVELHVEAEGGHSSMPPAHTAVGVLAGAIFRLESNPMSPQMNAPIRSSFEYIAPEMSYPNRAVFSNLWLFEPLVLKILAAKQSTNATIRTTAAATVFHGGVRDNVLPKSSQAKVNFRVNPGQSIAEVTDHIRDVIDDPAVEIRVPTGGFNSEPSPVSSVDGEGYSTLRTAIGSVWGDDVIVAPGLTIGGTDSRHMVPLGSDIYRFSPLELTPQDTPRIHGVDERISVENYERAIAFYIALIRSAAQPAPIVAP
jgi:carboxypeptidase PM20D1